MNSDGLLIPWNRLVRVTRGQGAPSAPEHVGISTNEKTGFSVNVPIVKTCRPTKGCAQYCYGLNGPIHWKNSVKRQLRNQARLDYLATAEETEVQAEAEYLVKRIQTKQNFLRWFGVGDLSLGAVRLINAMLKTAPELSLWVSTRRFDLVPLLDKPDNLHVMLGIDETMTPSRVAMAKKLLRSRGSNTFAAWVSRSPREQAPKWVTVIFAEHQLGPGRAKWTANGTDSRTCPATIKGGALHLNACTRCRFCFDTSIRQANPKGPVCK